MDMKQLSLFADLRPPIEDMADVVNEWLDEESSERRTKFIECEFDRLTLYHNTLGRNIRNHFTLWEYDWEPELRGGVDFSPEHPHQIAMRVIEEVWKRRQDV